MEIRECLPKDLPAVQELMVELAGYSDVSAPGKQEIEKTYETMSGERTFYRNWVALDGNTVVGFLSLVLYKTILHPNGTALINELVVDQGHRRQGVATSLVEHAVRFAEAEKAEEIEVGTEFQNTNAHKFYRKTDFDKEFLLFNREIR